MKEIVDNVKNSRRKTSAQDLWGDLMKNPNQWVSFVDDKSKGLVSPKYPDFKHTENSASLWLGSAPEWFLARIESLDLDSHCSKEKMWKSLAENPDQWLNFADDKSKGLVSPKHPDFMHRENGNALWLGSAPEWFLARIENLDLDSHCSKEKMWNSLAENPNQWVSFVDDKSKGLVPPKLPDFKHTENGNALWLDRAPEWFLVRIESLDLDLHCSKEKMWKSLAENPDQWLDYRADKRIEKAPDFKHKKSGVGLWLGESPEWFVAKDIGKLKDTKAEAWKSLAENPSQWWDNRLEKKNPKWPDFKHRDSGEALWLNRAPDWVVSKLPTLKQNQNVGGV